MILTAAQKVTLKAFIQGDATLGPKAAVGDYDFVANALNVNAAPAFYGWRTSVTEDEYVGTSGVDVANGNAATVWSWVGTGYITRAQGERDAWARLFRNGSIDPSQANVRQAFNDILSGVTAPAPANKNHLLVLSKRAMTVLEKVLATGTGSFATPATFGVQGRIGAEEIGGVIA